MAARRDVGVLFQNPENQLVGASASRTSVAFGLENLALGARRDPRAGRRDARAVRPRGTAPARAPPAVGRPEAAYGPRRRAGGAARVLVLDEPTAMLDPAGRAEVLDAVRREAGRPRRSSTSRRRWTRSSGRPCRRAGRPARWSTRGAWQACSATRELGAAARARAAGRPASWRSSCVERGAVGAAAAHPGRAGGGAPARRAWVAAARRPRRGTCRLACCAGVCVQPTRRARPRSRRCADVAELGPGRSLALLGASGSGKSTLLQVVRDWTRPRRAGAPRRGRPGEAGYAELRRQVGLVFQTPELQLFAASAREDVAFGPRRLGWPERR